MDFEFSDEQEQLRDAVRRWVDKGFGFERRHALAKAGGKTREVLGELNELGLAGLLKIRGSEIQQRYSELMMLAGGPSTVPYLHEAMEAGWQGDHVGAAHAAPLASTYFNMRKTTIYGGSNEVQRNIVAQTVLGA